MPTVQDYNRFGEELEKLLLLRTAPIALKMLKEESDVPEKALRPKRDLGEHLTLCQAFSLVRRQGKTVAMLKEDHWCVWPVIALGLGECNEQCVEEVHDKLFIKDPDVGREVFLKLFPRLEYGKYAGLLLSPLKTADFIPDVVLVYANPFQIRSLLWVPRYHTGTIDDCTFEVEFSCVFATVPVLQTGKFRATFPDPGEYERAFSDEEEMILSFPGNKTEELVSGLKYFEEIKFGYRNLAKVMKYDFPRPQFYDDLFKMWGLDQGEIWKR
ncbi:MAG: DUF169 domain-containing protein [Firmicutes bacterium]|jgi:uncharacterized protein (DUF169 family)|nr:DUF169 domain-containing protein [Bacillota bacterium]